MCAAQVEPNNNISKVCKWVVTSSLGIEAAAKYVMWALLLLRTCFIWCKKFGYRAK